MESRKRIGLVENDAGLSDALVMLPELSRYIENAYLSVAAFDKSGDPTPDVYLIDRNLDQDEGLDLCRP